MEKLNKEEHIKNWEKSGITKSSYCREHNLCYSTFMNWSKKKKTSQKESWKPIQVLDEALIDTRKNFIEIHIDGLWELSLRIQF